MADTQPTLATTKRKFHKILDNIAASASATTLAGTLHHPNASNTSLHNPTTPEHPNKRPRSSNNSMEQDKSISASQARIQALKDQLLVPTRKGTVRIVGKGTETPSKSSAPRKPANFQPHSQEQFLVRLETFADVKNWTSKPDSINEVQWARRGWSCESWNTVACRGCEKRVAVKLRPKRKDAEGNDLEMSEDLTMDIDEKTVGKFEGLIATGHSVECLWRNRGCPEEIYRIPIVSRAISSAQLVARYNSFRAISSDLPLLENITYPDPSISDILDRLPTTVFKPNSSTEPPVPAPSSEADKVALLLAFFGWTGLSESRISLATCNHCFQRIGLWLSSDARLKEMSQKLNIPISSLRLNLVESHREHCPWKSPAVQNNPDDGPVANMAAWESLQFIVLSRSKLVSDAERLRQERGHSRNVDSVDMGSEAEYPRGSMESYRADQSKEDNDAGKLQEKWKKFKARLRRTTSKKSLKSVKSVRSGKSTATGREVDDV